jgi:hypothetical protein
MTHPAACGGRARSDAPDLGIGSGAQSHARRPSAREGSHFKPTHGREGRGEEALPSISV